MVAVSFVIAQPASTRIATQAAPIIPHVASAARLPRATQPSQPASQPGSDDVRAFLVELEQAIQSGQHDRYLSLVSERADRARAESFAEVEVPPRATRVVIQERDREHLAGTLPGNGYRLVVDTFIEMGSRARVTTWRLDLRRPRVEDPWRIAEQEGLTSVEGLYRLSLDSSRQFEAHDLIITAEDLDLTLGHGSVFVVETDQGVTGLMLLGQGLMRFKPRPETERGQVKIFCGSEALESAFDAAFVRINPADFDARIARDRLITRVPDPRAFRRADAMFREQAPKSFGLDLGDLSRDSWSLLPSPGDFLADVRTRRFGTLTYARSASEPEDITLFDRKRHRNIAIYASERKLAVRGRFYNEDDLVDYDVLDYDIDLNVIPDRLWLEGRARMRLRIRSFAVASLTLRLADALVVQSIVSERFGRLFGVRIRNQNSVVVNLPSTVPRGSEVALTVSYSGRLEPQTPDPEAVASDPVAAASDPEAVALQRAAAQEEIPLIAPEPSFLYSNRSYWYPQGSVTGYATARLRLTVPAGFECIASGDPASGSPSILAAHDQVPARKVYEFIATQPVRYLAFLVSRFVRSDTATVPLLRSATDSDGLLTGVSYESLNLSVDTNPRQTQRGHDYAERAADIVRFYTSMVGDCPYPSLAIAVVESNRPGGHSPGYFAALDQPLPSSPFTWRNDPEAFPGYPEFYLAHELAHQWWGQAVGWRNYHEQWLSEGFAEYFAALYAQHHRGGDAFAGVLRQLRRWGMAQSGQGPIYLGYRLGHIRGEPRVFSALVYNKAGAVMHMLRRLVGDEAFFRGIRRFYRTSRFHKAGTEDFRRAMEAAAGQPLGRFFERWIYGSSLPRLKFSYRTEGGDVVLHVEQVGEIFDVPITVVLRYADRRPVEVLLPLAERTTERRVRLTGVLRSVEISRDDGTMAEIVR